MKRCSVTPDCPFRVEDVPHAYLEMMAHEQEHRLFLMEKEADERVERWKASRKYLAGV